MYIFMSLIYNKEYSVKMELQKINNNVITNIITGTGPDNVYSAGSIVCMVFSNLQTQYNFSFNQPTYINYILIGGGSGGGNDTRVARTSCDRYQGNPPRCISTRVVGYETVAGKGGGAGNIVEKSNINTNNIRITLGQGGTVGNVGGNTSIIIDSTTVSTVNAYSQSGDTSGISPNTSNSYLNNIIKDLGKGGNGKSNGNTGAVVILFDNTQFAPAPLTYTFSNILNIFNGNNSNVVVSKTFVCNYDFTGTILAVAPGGIGSGGSHTGSQPGPGSGGGGGGWYYDTNFNFKQGNQYSIIINSTSVTITISNGASIVLNRGSDGRGATGNDERWTGGPGGGAGCANNAGNSFNLSCRAHRPSKNPPQA